MKVDISTRIWQQKFNLTQLHCNVTISGSCTGQLGEMNSIVLQFLIIGMTVNEMMVNVITFQSHRIPSRNIIYGFSHLIELMDLGSFFIVLPIFLQQQALQTTLHVLHAGVFVVNFQLCCPHVAKKTCWCMFKYCMKDNATESSDNKRKLPMYDWYW